MTRSVSKEDIQCLRHHAPLFGINWPDQIRCLGIYVGYVNDKNLKSNWSDKIDKIKRISANWRGQRVW